jgi:hypothetical protein
MRDTMAAPTNPPEAIYPRTQAMGTRSAATSTKMSSSKTTTLNALLRMEVAVSTKDISAARTSMRSASARTMLQSMRTTSKVLAAIRAIREQCKNILQSRGFIMHTTTR